MKKFDFNSFVQEQFEQHQNAFTVEEVKDILYLGEDAYTKDSPKSTGKTLVLNFLAFKGKKDDGSIIDYNVELKRGLTIWITKNSNLKGKSSIFKIIKFALTGDNSIKDDVNKWIEEILLCFSIGVHQYTAYIINKKRGLIAKLYNTRLGSWEEIEISSKEPLFETTTENDFKSQIQDFFFQQFSYYSLKWTQKPPQKDALGLMEVGASWNTYFKSIYLESKDYGVLFFSESLSHQGQKIFQTLMGLELTYPINKLTIKRDNLLNEKAKEKERNQNAQVDTSNKKSNINNQILAINQQINDLNKTSIPAQNQEIINLEKHNKELLLVYQQATKTENECRELRRRKDFNEAELEQKRNAYRVIQNRIDSINKRIIELNEHIEIGVFFSNLDVKNCPSCHHIIDEVKKTTNLNAHKCPLCSDTVEGSNEIDKDSYENKIKELEFELGEVRRQQGLVQEEGNKIKTQLEIVKENLIEKETELQKVDTETILSQVQAIQSRINILLAQNPINNPQREELIAKKAVLEYQLKEIEHRSAQETLSNDYDRKIKLLEKAIEALINKRYEIGTNTLHRLQELMLKEVQSFGINSISAIRITEKFDVKYTQSGEEISFEKISEGEQLRAKLAFYLSLIQLDIEYNMGKHTRFLMIDSPGKEEAGKKYMTGLISVLQGIEKRYADKLQILIATADSRFEDVLKNQFIYPEESYIF